MARRFWRSIVRGTRALVNPRTADADADDEIRHFLDESAADLESRGVPAAEARRAARSAWGHPVAMREQVRGSGWEHVVATVAADVRHGIRRLRRTPGFTIVAISTLALGIGASTAIFSAVNPILFTPLPYPQSGRIVTISDSTQAGAPVATTFGTYREIVQRNRSFEALAPLRPWQPTLMGDGEPERLQGQRVGAEYFRALGVAPRLGRDFVPAEDRVNGPKVLLLGDGLWRRRFGADPAIVGREISIDDVRYLVVGVMPASFENATLADAELWTPLQYDTVLRPEGREWGHHLRLIGRLRDGVSIAAARTELGDIARTPMPEFPRVAWASLANGLVVSSLQEDVTRGVRTALLALMLAVLVVLAIASANVTNLLLARVAQRRGEFAMRAALGAGRARLLGQLVTETMVLAIAGGLLGLGVAALGVNTLVAMSPPGLPRVHAIRLDTPVFIFALAITTGVGAIAGLVSAFHGSGRDLQPRLTSASRRTGRGRDRTRRALVVVEVALALTLLVGAGLLWRSLTRIFDTPAGFDATNVLTMQIQQAGRRFPTDARRLQFFADVLERLRQVPGADIAALTSQLPLSGDLDGYGAHLESDGSARNNDTGVLRYAVTPEYFEVLRIPLRRGRLLTARDDANAPRAAVVGEGFARAAFGGDGASAMGQRMQIGPDDGRPYTIVGIVGDVKQTSLGAADPGAVYIPMTQWHWADTVMSLVVRTRDDAASLAPSVRQAIWSVDKDQPVLRVSTLSRLVDLSEADRRFALTLFEAFAGASLLLAAIGIYGILAGAVTERTREIGVRSALGASRGDVLALVVRDAMTLAGTGIVLGVGGAAATTRGLRTMLFDTSPLDPVTYAAVVATLLAVAAIACCAPAWRAARVDPVIALRAD
jgi:putative ABC transport system permease protein